MAAGKYPYTAWRLMGSGAVRQTTLVAKYYGGGWEKTDTGALVQVSTLFETPKAAIKAGKALIDQQRARHVKAGQNIEKRAAALAKAEAEHG